MELRFVEGNFEHGKFKLQMREYGMNDWIDVPCVKEEPSKPTLAERLYKAWKKCEEGDHDWSKTLGQCLADEAKKAMEELVDEICEPYCPSDQFLIMKDKLIERIKAL